MEQEVRQQWIQGERLMAKKKETIRRGSKEWWAKKSAEAPELENKRFKYKSPSFKQSEYGKTTYYQKGEDGKFRYSEDYIPVQADRTYYQRDEAGEDPEYKRKEREKDVTYVPIAKRFDRETGGFKATPVRETKVESGTPEVETPEVKTTTSSSSTGEGEVSRGGRGWRLRQSIRELWTDKNQTPPKDLKVWVKKGREEDGIWRNSKNNVTVLYSEDKGFELQYQDDTPSGSSGSGTAWEKP